MIRKEHVTALSSFRKALLELAVSDLVDRHQAFGMPVKGDPANVKRMVDLRQQAITACRDLNAEQFTEALMLSNFLE